MDAATKSSKFGPATLCLALLASLPTTSKAEQGLDVLTIHSITAIAITDALDDTSMNLIYLSGATLMAAARFGTPKGATGVAFSVAKVAYAGGTGDLALGGDAALLIANLVDIITDTHDDLLVYVADQAPPFFIRRVVPAAGVDANYVPIYQGRPFNLNLTITKPASEAATLIIYEYDVGGLFGSPSDFLGDVSFRNGYTISRDRIYVPSPAEGSLYSVEYSYEKDAGKYADLNTYYQSITPEPFEVTPSAGANGQIRDSKFDTIVSEFVTPNTTTTFVILPNRWYRAEMGGTCGGQLVGNTYTTNPITAACTVVASFVEIDTDADGVTDRNDAFPNDPTETMDSDGDGIGDVADIFPNAVTTLIASGGGDKAVTVSVEPDSDSFCSLTTVSVQPVGSPKSGFLGGVQNQVSFTLTGCEEGEAVKITLDFGEPMPIRATGVKVDVDSWTQINGASYTDSTVTYSLVDNGVYDTNPDAGSISDPVTVASRPPTIPVMPFSLLALLGALLTYLGVKELSRNSRKNN